MRSHKKKKILIISPSFPFPSTGAEQADRAEGIKQFIRLGFDVRVIVKLVSWKSPEEVKKIADTLGVIVIPVSYKYSNKNLSFSERLRKNFLRFLNPLYLDGAAFEYAEEEMQSVVEREVDDWHPDVVWFDYTYLWPLYRIFQKRNIPIITRSINFEPSHFLEEDGFYPLNLFKFLFKLASEFLVVRRSDFLFSITPKEEKIYRRLGAKKNRQPAFKGIA